jgi:hypothetical protein
MKMLTGRRYRCQNRECGAEIEVMRDSIEGRSILRCCCGTVMKMPYSKPILTTLKNGAASKAFAVRSMG